MVCKTILSAVIGYLLGSVVAAIIISKLFFKEDVRDLGSGNSGATNAARVYGLGFGVMTFIIDLIKGVAACALGRLIGGDLCMATAGIACLIGHCLPLWFGFRGGKGVSVGAALALMIDWRIFVIAIAVFLAAVLITRIVSLSSLCGTLIVGVLSAVLAGSPYLKAAGVIAALIVFFMHRSNIKRLASGSERRITFGKRR